MNDRQARDQRHFSALFALMYDHFVERDPRAAAFKWVEARANLARFDSLLGRDDARRALAQGLAERSPSCGGLAEIELEAAFVLLYEGVARYRASDYVFSPEDWHHLYRARLACAMTASEAMSALERDEESIVSCSA